MKESEMNQLLEQINALVDDTAGSTHERAVGIQRIAANLPRLRRSAILGWDSARQLAVAFNSPATERAAVRALVELGDES